jgi:hypothetical protein
MLKDNRRMSERLLNVSRHLTVVSKQFLTLFCNVRLTMTTVQNCFLRLQASPKMPRMTDSAKNLDFLVGRQLKDIDPN